MADTTAQLCFTAALLLRPPDDPDTDAFEPLVYDLGGVGWDGKVRAALEVITILGMAAYVVVELRELRRAAVSAIAVG